MREVRTHASSASHALVVGLGIFLSRVAGLVRERAFAHYFGNSVAADAFRAAARIPNLLQNLLGEGVLSASFIPVYARLRAQGREEEATRLASAVGAVLAVTVSVLVALGVLASPWLVELLAPGFEAERRSTTVLLVRILFPGIGCLVLSAWCLGVLNCHGRFFLAYAAPIAWNLAQIAALVAGSHYVSGRWLAQWLSWGAVAGSLLQLVIQLPTVLRLLGGFRPALRRVRGPIQEVARNFIPVLFSRGVIQLSAYVDSVIASWLPVGAVAALAYGQILYLLPVSLFGMAITAAELPEMSSVVGTADEVKTALRQRLEKSQVRMAFLVLPACVVFAVLGDVVASALFQTGQFTPSDAVYVWTILGGATLGLLGITRARLYSSAFYALGDTRTPLHFSLARLTLGAGLGWLLALRLPGWIGLAASWGAAGLTLAASVAGWLEFWGLRRSLHARIGAVAIGRPNWTRLWLATGLSALLAVGLRWPLPSMAGLRPWLIGCLLLVPYALSYWGIAWVLGLEPARSLAYSLVHRLRNRAP
ncbi:murein biosynthesis integral membrane protein MurJ [Myxococcota bacterium]